MGKPPGGVRVELGVAERGPVPWRRAQACLARVGGSISAADQQCWDPRTLPGSSLLGTFCSFGWFGSEE